ncbi:PE-PPE domain-containing protein [Mycobacterium sp. shizuoka-1]|uniref:PE-PPE domain-containing protein n=1 Tax=Mycobacterium sp. shizuoka-1 TaxID=2039281 RepID=UPI0013047998|nr:PE-PPE domain-containing protein [Mycobacterium sp. shizuoka-1]
MGRGLFPTLVAAAVATVVGGITSIFPGYLTSVAAAGTTVLVMGGTGHPLSTPPDTLPYVRQFVDAAVNNYVSPASSTGSTGIPDGPYNGVAVITPEEDAPRVGTLPVKASVNEGLAKLHSCVTSSVCDYNLDVGSVAPSGSDSFVVFGYSQSAVIAMLEKADLAAEYAAGEGPAVTFVVIGNSRPNGSLTARDTSGLVTFLLLGVRRDEQLSSAVPTDTQYATVDIAIQYDGISDFPVNPLNLLAVLNAYAGMGFVHTTYTDHSLSEPGIVDQGQYGDTHYYLVHNPVLPLLTAVQLIPVVGPALAAALDPPLRVLVEAGYDRTVSPGQPTSFNLLHFPDPVTTTVDFLRAIPVGWDNALQDVFDSRPFGTTRPGPYGVGGPEVEYAALDSPPATATTPATTSKTTASAPTTRAVGRAKPRGAHRSAPRAARSVISKPPASSRATTSAGKSLGVSKRAS